MLRRQRRYTTNSSRRIHMKYISHYLILLLSLQCICLQLQYLQANAQQPSTLPSLYPSISSQPSISFVPSYKPSYTKQPSHFPSSSSLPSIEVRIAVMHDCSGCMICISFVYSVLYHNISLLIHLYSATTTNITTYACK